MIIIMVFQAINQVFPDLYLTKQKVLRSDLPTGLLTLKVNNPAPGWP